jgi:DNA-binding SARP family transcriptional activator
VSRDRLVDALWPRYPPADPATNLRILISRARQALGDTSLIVTEAGGYSFAATGAFSLDTETFLEAVAAGSRLIAQGKMRGGLEMFDAALARWAEPLPEFACESWATPYRERLERAHLEALEGAALTPIPLT